VAYKFSNKSFCDIVYQITKRIPCGKVATYGQIASLAGNPKAARAVGMCMKHNSDIPNIPCHRVVSSTGNLTGYSAGEGTKTKREMLEREGVVFVGNKVNLAMSKWSAHKILIPIEIREI
jgi:O-6-methylguanine DNA methyltransferase